MRRALTTALLATALGLVATAASAGEIYQWKDANGVTHYSETPPPKGQYVQRSIRDRGARPAAPAAQAAAPTDNPQCADARNNIALLQSGQALQVDANGDGKPDRLIDDAERKAQLEMARIVERNSCTPKPSTP